MRQIRVGDRVRAFLNANISGKVVEIFLHPSGGAALMVGGVPPMVAYARVLLQDGNTVAVKTTELSILDS